MWRGIMSDACANLTHFVRHLYIHSWLVTLHIVLLCDVKVWLQQWPVKIRCDLITVLGGTDVRPEACPWFLSSLFQCTTRLSQYLIRLYLAFSNTVSQINTSIVKLL